MAAIDDALTNAGRATDQFFKPVTDFATGLPGQFNDLMKGQLGSMNQFLGRYSGAIKGQESVPSMYQRTGLENNIPNLRENANMLNTAVQNIPFTYGSSSRGFDVNANQLSRIIGQKTYELTPAMTSANNALSSALGNQQQQVGATQTQQAKELLPYQSEQQMLGDYFSRQATGFTQANQQELDGLLAKASAGMALTSGELERANQLAMIEKQYKLQLDNWKAKVGYTGQVGLAGLLGLAGGTA